MTLFDQGFKTGFFGASFVVNGDSAVGRLENHGFWTPKMGGAFRGLESGQFGKYCGKRQQCGRETRKSWILDTQIAA